MTASMTSGVRRVGAIDLGTNTAMLLVVEASADGTRRVLVDRELYPRLGEGLDEAGCLSGAARERTLKAVRALADEARCYDTQTLSLVGTSALRDGDKDGSLLAELRAIVPSSRVIDGAEEARLTTSGALAVTGVRGAFVCIDVGGGSTEVVFGETAQATHAFEVRFAASLPLGSVRLHGRHAEADEPFLEAYGDARTLLFDALPCMSVDSHTVIAVAGSAATVGALALMARDEAWHEGARIGTREVDAVVERLVLTSEDDRAAMHPWLAQRADVAPYGAIVLQAVLHHLAVRELVVSTAGVRWGLAIDLLDGG